MPKIIVFLLFFLLPGLLIIVFARRIVAWNARAFPRRFGSADRALDLLVQYIVGAGWIVLGLKFLLA